MVLPLIPLILVGTGATTALGGVIAGVRGGLMIKGARSDDDQARARLAEAAAETEAAVASVNDRVRAFGQQQEAARRAVVLRMADFIRRHSRIVRESAWACLDGVSVEQRDLVGPAGRLVDQGSLFAAAGVAAASGYGVSAGVQAAVTAVGSASTGTAIGTLSGAAAESALLAWLGGGSIAAGGGGVALGATALNVVTVGPALLISGIAINVQGEKAKTKTREATSKIDIVIADHHAFRSTLDGVHLRVDEAEMVLSQLVQRGVAALDALDALDFGSGMHAPDFERAMTLVLAVREICSLQLLGEDGQINSESMRMILSYREAGR
ncbi:hypothetical protein F1C76_02135 [Geodermatophilaceae bacterium NBWT11]|nr:hypothetical protein F1C76_02135 [Geodermatophilaceae bacterium NBWT11]